MLEGLTPPPKFTGTCKVNTVASDLDAKDREILLNAVNDASTWPVKTLRKALAERGIQISDSPLYSHRAKSCSCFRG